MANSVTVSEVRTTSDNQLRSITNQMEAYLLEIKQFVQSELLIPELETATFWVDPTHGFEVRQVAAATRPGFVGWPSPEATLRDNAELSGAIGAAAEMVGDFRHAAAEAASPNLRHAAAEAASPNLRHAAAEAASLRHTAPEADQPSFRHTAAEAASPSFRHTAAEAASPNLRHTAAEAASPNLRHTAPEADQPNVRHTAPEVPPTIR